MTQEQSATDRPGEELPGHPGSPGDTGDAGGAGPGAITDDQLPQDLVPGEDNPLAEPAEEGQSAIDADLEPGGEHERGYDKDPDRRPTRDGDG